MFSWQDQQNLVGDYSSSRTATIVFSSLFYYQDQLIGHFQIYRDGLHLTEHLSEEMFGTYFAYLHFVEDESSYSKWGKVIHNEKHTMNLLPEDLKKMIEDEAERTKRCIVYLYNKIFVQNYFCLDNLFHFIPILIPKMKEIEEDWNSSGVLYMIKQLLPALRTSERDDLHIYLDQLSEDRQ